MGHEVLPQEVVRYVVALCCSISVASSKRSPTQPPARRNARSIVHPRTCAEARSSHCSSSTTHASGRRSAVWASRPNVASPATKTGPAPARTHPNTTRRASPCRSGKQSRPSSSGAHNWCKPANASSISELHTRRPVPPGTPPRVQSSTAASPSSHTRLAAQHQRPALSVHTRPPPVDQACRTRTDGQPAASHPAPPLLRNARCSG